MTSNDPSKLASQQDAHEFVSHVSKEQLTTLFAEALTASLDAVVEKASRRALLQLQLGDDLLVSQDELADLLHVSPRHVARLVADGVIRPAKSGRTPVYSLGSVRRILQEAAVPE